MRFFVRLFSRKSGINRIINRIALFRQSCGIPCSFESIQKMMQMNFDVSDLILFIKDLVFSCDETLLQFVQEENPACFGLYLRKKSKI